MTAGAPWSVKGIDPKAREIAKDLARRSGMTLGEWLNQVILEDGPVEQPTHYTTFSHEPATPTYRRFEASEHPGDELSRVTEALERLSARIEAAEHRSTLAISGVDQSVSGLVSRLTANEREQTAVAARFEGLADDLKVDQNRITERLRRIEQEAAGPRSAEALRAMEAALGKVAGHVYEGEARTSEQLNSLRQELETVAERVDRGAAGLDAGEMIEAVVSRVAERLEQAGMRTNEALKELEVSFGRLDDRLHVTETRLDGRAGEAGLESLAVSLSARVDAARAEMAEKIRASADGRFDRMEQTLSELNGHVQAAERRSAQAIESMGHEVLRMAETLGRKVDDVEHRSAGAIEKVSGEMGRIANAMESRLSNIDTAGAQALEKLGGEIARITERLSERIANAERRSAQAIDDVGDQMARVSERLQERQERGSSELAERIRLSEERTARLLEDARERIDQRLGETQRRLEQAAAPVAAPVYVEPGVAPFGQTQFPYVIASDRGLTTDGDLSGHGLPEQDLTLHNLPEQSLQDHSLPEDDFAPRGLDARDLGVRDFGASEPAPHDSAAHDFEADEFVSAAPHASAHGALAADDEQDLLTPRNFVDDEFGEPAAFGHSAAPARPSSFGEPSVYDEDPAHAEASPFDLAQDDEDDGFIKTAHRHDDPAPYTVAPYTADAYAPSHDDQAVDHDETDEALFAPPSTTRELIEQARAAARAASQEKAGKNKAAEMAGALFSGFSLSLGKKKAKGGSPLRTMLLLSGVVAAAGVSTAGYVLLNDKPGGATPPRVADGLNSATKLSNAELARPLAAVALNPTPVATTQNATAVAPNSEAAINGPALYEDGARRIEAHDFSGVDALHKAANLGYAPAEFYLAKLYEEGQAGLRKDLGEARVWTERAAESGDRKAMHNLALYYFEGTGGPKNMTTAAEWFRKAADLGLVDSQYNLARLYEKGFGVSQNTAEAYKWYLIASRSGDADSRQSAQQLKTQLSVESQAAAERAAQSFRPQGPDATNLAAGLNLTTQVAQATTAANPVGGDTINLQRALSRLGYYQGPTDGVSSPALRLAIAAYQRDQGLPGTGVLDQSSEQLLYAAAQ